MPLPRQFRLPFRGTRELRRDIDAELDHHLAAVADDLVRQGMDPDAAAQEARTLLGDRAALQRALLRQGARGEWGQRMLTILRETLADAGFAFRLAARRGGTAALIVATLALGIGVATTFATAVDAIVFRPLALAEPDRVMSLVRVEETTGRTDGVAPGTIADWRERSRAFVAIAGTEPYSLSYREESGPVSIGTWRVTERYFDVFQATPVAGRLLEEADFEPSAEAVVVVSYPFWASRFGADPAAVGSILSLGGDQVPYRLVGVLPADFPYADGRDLYVPRPLVGPLRQNRYANYYPTFGRLAAGSTRESAEAEMRRIAAATALEFPDSDAGLSVAVSPLASSITDGARPALLLLLLASLLILAIACVNAASLILAEAARRSRELAVRAALGAGRWRIVRQVAAEVGLLAIAAGLLGVAIAAAGVGAFRRLAPEGLPRLNELAVDGRLLLLGTATSVVVALLVAVAPALRGVGADLHLALKAGGRGGLRSRESIRLRSALVTVQVSLAVVVLAGGGLLLRSWMALGDTDQGYSPVGVVGAEAHIWGSHPTPESQRLFTREAVRRLQEAPGIRASIASSLPLSDGIGNEDAEVQAPGALRPLEAFGVIADEGYFDLLGIPVLEGRGIDRDIRAEGEPVVVISDAIARHYWPGGGAVGSLLSVSYGGPPVASRVIGVVGDVQYQSLERAQGPTVYLPFVQSPTGSFFVVAAGAQPSSATDPLVRSVLRDMAPTLAFGQVVQLEQQVWSAGKGRRFSLLILGAFGMVSAALTAIGLFGLMAHMIRMRTRELGIRLALGALPRRLQRLVLRQAAALVALGVALGVVAFLLGGGLMRRMVYGVVTNDPVTIVAVALAVGLLALTAVWQPARMATRIDPAAALRAD